MRYIFLSLSLLILGYNSSFSQKIQNVKAEVHGDNIVVTYDLIHTEVNQDFKISLYSSKDQFTTALKYVSGDVGSGVKPGKNKKIVWSAREELGEYEGDITFEVRGVPVSGSGADVAIIKPSKNEVIRRGKTYEIKWKGANQSQTYELELLRNGKTVDVINNAASGGAYNWKIPVKTKPGKKYSVKITNSGNSQDFAMSDPFIIKRKIPLALKIVPVAVIITGGAIAALLAVPVEDETVKEDPDLPAPPNP
ncbi:MAG: GPI anchored serine-threonine rich family protein [Cytophagaceae bacterium]